MVLPKSNPNKQFFPCVVQADGAPARALGYEGNVELVRELTEDNGALAAEIEKLQGRCGEALLGHVLRLQHFVFPIYFLLFGKKGRQTKVVVQ